MNKQQGLLDSFQLKIIALAFMILDHLDTYIFSSVWPKWIDLVTRFVSPLFLYLLLVGFYHTRSRKKYAARLFIAGVIMMCGNIAINLYFHNVDVLTGHYTFSSLVNGNDIFLTLADMFMLFWCLQTLKTNKTRSAKIFSVLGIVFFAALSVFLEGGIYLLPLAFIFWLCYGKNKKLCVLTAAYCLLLFLYAVYSWSTGGTQSSLFDVLCFNDGWAMVTVLPFILLYNGKRGISNAFSKYLFYVIYPAHIWPLMILANLHR